MIPKMHVASTGREAAKPRPTLRSADRHCSAAADSRHRVIIVGGGFGGLAAVNGLAGLPLSITLIDQRNYHLFQPLLYQVATASLATSEIAWPIRYLVRNRPEVTTLLAMVVGVDVAARRVLLDSGDSLPYDTLILATGARHAYLAMTNGRRSLRVSKRWRMQRPSVGVSWSPLSAPNLRPILNNVPRF